MSPAGHPSRALQRVGYNPRQPLSYRPRRSHWPGRIPVLGNKDTPRWNPDIERLFPDLRQEDFTQLTTAIQRLPGSLRIASYNVNGRLLESASAGSPSPLQQLAWLFHHLGLDFLMIQEHRIPAPRLAEFYSALATIGTLPTPEGGRSARPLEGFISPATQAGEGGCLILCAAGWAPRHPRHTPLPNGRGQLLEVCGQGEKRLLLANVYGKAAAANSFAALHEAEAIFAQAASTIKPYLEPSRNRVLILGGDLNAPWTLGVDRHLPIPPSRTQPGDAATRDLLRDFAAKCGVLPLPTEPGLHPAKHAFTVRADRATETPGILAQECCKVTKDRSCPARLDYLMADIKHHAAVLGSGTLTRLVANLHSDHSMIFVDLERQALLGRCDDVERRVRAAAAQHTRSFLPDTEDRTQLFAELDARSALFQAESKQLETMRAQHEAEGPTAAHAMSSLQALNDAWARFGELNNKMARQTNPKYFDTRPRKPGRTSQLGAEFHHSAQLTRVHQSYLSTRRQPNTVTAALANATNLPQHLLVPTITRGTLTVTEKLSEWRAWGTALGKHHRELRATIAKAKRKLIKERIEARWHEVVTEAYKQGGHAGQAYKSTFRKQQANGRPTASVLVYDEELGHITVRCDGPAVREEVSRFYGSMVRATPANRHPSDPLASPKQPMPASFHKVVNARKIASYPKLTRYITPERWQELIQQGDHDTAAGKSGLSYKYVAEAPLAVQEFLRSMVNLCLQAGCIPEAWHEALLFPLTKDPTKGASIQNGRPICLLEIPLKLLTRHLNDAIQDTVYLQELMHKLQNGFSRKLGTETALRLLTTLLNTRAHQGKATHVAYLDLASAFNSVPHWAIRQALERFNVPEWAVTLMMQIDDGGLTQAITDHGLGRAFAEESGTRQGCILSPIKFVMWADALLTWLDELESDIVIPGQGAAMTARAIRAIFFADDMALISSNQRQLQVTLDRVHSFLSYYGVAIQERKSYYTTNETGFRPRTPDGDGHGLYFTRQRRKVWLQGVPADTAVKYLGLRIALDGNTRVQLAHMHEQISTCLADLRKSPLPLPLQTMMLAGKLGGMLGYSLPFVQIQHAVTLNWLARVQQYGKHTLNLHSHTPPEQFTAHPEAQGFGFLHVQKLQHATLARSMLRGLNQGHHEAQPTLESDALVRDLEQYRSSLPHGLCPLLAPEIHEFSRASLWTTLAQGLEGAGLHIADGDYVMPKTARAPPRVRDLPLLQAILRHLRSSTTAEVFNRRRTEFNSTIQPLLAKQGMHLLSHVVRACGTRLIAQPQGHQPRWHRWLQQHLTAGPELMLPETLWVSGTRGHHDPPLQQAWARPLPAVGDQPSRHEPGITVSLRLEHRRHRARHRTHYAGFAPSQEHWVVVTDGSSTHDGTRGSYSAVVAVGPRRTVTCGVARGRCTPLRAELLGLLEGLWLCPLDSPASIVLDCETAIRLAPHLPDILERHPHIAKDQLWRGYMRGFVKDTDANLDVLRAIVERYAARTAPLHWVWYPGHAFDDAPEERTPLGHCQHHADAACRWAVDLLERPSEIHGLQYADHRPLIHQPRFTLREQTGAICIAKPKPLLYERATKNIKPAARSNTLTTSWQLPTHTEHMQNLVQGKIDRGALLFFTKLRVNQMFTPAHWQDFLRAAGHTPPAGPLPACSGCDTGAIPTPIHVLVECPTAHAEARAHMHLLTGVLANRGSGPWDTLDVLAKRVEQLVSSHTALALGESALASRTKKVIQPQGTQTADDVLRHGVVFKHAARPGGVLRERDRAASKTGTPTRKPKGKPSTMAPQEDSVTVVYIDPPPGRSGRRQVLPHRAVALHDVYDPSCKPSSSFQQELWDLCTRAEEASALAAEQWWTSRPLLTSMLARVCHVTVELFGAPLSMSEIPIRFSADREDGAFGFRHDSLFLDDGTPRNWALLAKACLQDRAAASASGPAPSKLVCLYANVEYLTQLHTLLEYARTLLETGDAEHLSIRLFAIFPVGPTKAALTQTDIENSGGELLTLHGHSCYDFLPYRHWLGRAHSNAKFSKAAPIQVGLARWETTSAGVLHPMSDRERTAVREWALASCLRDPALPTPKSPTDDPSPNLSFHSELRTPEMILHPRLKLYHSAA